jgi:hypothetical protein
MSPLRWLALVACGGWIASGGCCCIVFPIDFEPQEQARADR